MGEVALYPATDPLREQFSISEQLLRRNVKRFRGGLVFKAHRLFYPSTLGLRLITKRRRARLLLEGLSEFPVSGPVSGFRV